MLILIAALRATFASIRSVPRVQGMEVLAMLILIAALRATCATIIYVVSRPDSTVRLIPIAVPVLARAIMVPARPWSSLISVSELGVNSVARQEGSWQ